MNKPNYPPAKTDNYKWLLLFFLWVAFFLHQGTRQIYNAILPQIQGTFGVDSLKMGVVGSVFTMTYGVCAMFSGVASDMLDRKFMVVSGLFIFCMGIFCSAWVSGIGMMVVFYGLMNGLGQAFYYPAACSLLGQLHENTRATALGIHQTALYAGIVICSCVSGYLGDIDSVCGCAGWRVPFAAFGAIGIMWAAFLAFAMRRTAPLSASSRGPAPQKASLKDAFFVVFRKPAAIMLALGFGMHIYVDCGFKTWMPTFLRETFGFDGAGAAFNAVIWHYLGAIVGVVIGGRASDKLAKIRKTIRFETNIFGLMAASPFIYAMARADTAAACFAGMFLFGLFRGIYDSNMFASLFDVVAPRYRASASGIMLCFGFIIGSTAPAVLGFMRDHFGISAGMASLAFFYFAGGVFILLARNFFFNRDYEG